MLGRLWRSLRAGPEIEVGIGCLLPIAAILALVAATSHLRVHPRSM
jgi:hypothetical protein